MNLKLFICSSCCLLTISLIANQGVNTNPNLYQPPPTPSGNQYQNQPPVQTGNFQNQQQFQGNDSFLQQNTSPDNQEGDVQQNDGKPSNILFDIKTPHGSIIIKKLTQQTTADTQGKPDHSKSSDTSLSKNPAQQKPLITIKQQN